jgi:hypothetical protein
MADDREPLAGLVELWAEKLKRAGEQKWRDFGEQAARCMQFYAPKDKNYNFLYRNDKDGKYGVSFGVPEPTFKMTLNKVCELVQIFGPFLYNKNPHRKVEPRKLLPFEPELMGSDAVLRALMPQQAPMGGDTASLAASYPMPGPGMALQYAEAMLAADDIAEQEAVVKSRLLEAYLNYTPNEMLLKDHADQAIVEALVKGRGCLWTEIWSPPSGASRYIGSFFDSVDYLLIDPDAESIETAWWIARKQCHPVWEVERKFGLKPGDLKRYAKSETRNAAAEVDSTGREFDRARGITNDLVIYYEIYSKMGVGGRLSGSNINLDEIGLLPGDLEGIASVLDPIAGDHVYLAIVPGCPWPLNLPPTMMDATVVDETGQPTLDMQSITAQLQWPLPFYEDGAWPVSVLDFHYIPRKPWPQSHVEPALGELQALNWLYSFMMGKAQVTLRTIIAVLKELGKEFKLQVLDGADLTVVELDPNNRSISECVQILQYPQMNQDIWSIIQAIESNLDKRLGLNELMYGESSRQIRSAAEADLKASQTNVRPDDMAERVESWMTQAARKEAIAARLLLQPQDLAPVLGQVGATLWGRLVSTPDPVAACRELEYRIESGSMRKPNRERDQSLANEAMQSLLPSFQSFAAAGVTQPINALITYWARSRDLDPNPFLLPSLPPPPPVAPAPAAGEEAAGGSGSPQPQTEPPSQ